MRFGIICDLRLNLDRARKSTFRISVARAVLQKMFLINCFINIHQLSSYGIYADIPSNIPTFLHSNISAFLHSYIPTTIHSYIPTFLNSYIPTFHHSILLNLFNNKIMQPLWRERTSKQTIIVISRQSPHSVKTR